LNPNVTGGDLWPTAYHAMAYDSQNGVTIRFAGSTTLSTRTNETWEYDYSGNTWTMLDPTIVGPPGGLPGRIHHAMVYDDNAGVIIMMGGLGRENGSSVLLDDTWEYSRGSNTWTKLQPTIEGGTFVARYLHAMAYDPAADTTILLGGLDVNGTELGDTWEYDHSTNTWTWIDTTIVGGSSIARGRHAMVYDSHIASIVLFGGTDCSS
jgi:N-acetylneuraminic acid mutarotase